jgi:hypothetical protein
MLCRTAYAENMEGAAVHPSDHFEGRCEQDATVRPDPYETVRLLSVFTIEQQELMPPRAIVSVRAAIRANNTAGKRFGTS